MAVPPQAKPAGSLRPPFACAHPPHFVRRAASQRLPSLTDEQFFVICTIMQTADSFYKSLFGTKTYKISLDAGCTCPNRDGTLGYGGCLFCGEKGSGEFAANKILPVELQVEEAKKLVNSKFSRKISHGIDVPKKYIAYFQNFTNTYGNIKNLSEKWEAALKCPDVLGLALGTRPDCISKECLSVLKDFSDRGIFVQVELGLQTSDDKTAAFLNRGYKTKIYEDAVERLHKTSPKIHVVTHILFGLPTGKNFCTEGGIESKEQMLPSVQKAAVVGTDGIKIANLYV